MTHRHCGRTDYRVRHCDRDACASSATRTSAPVSRATGDLLGGRWGRSARIFIQLLNNIMRVCRIQ